MDEQQEGVLVQQITAGSPADEAEMIGSYKPFEVDGEEIMIGGDVITAVDNQAVSSINELSSVIGTYQPDDVISLTILREGEKLMVSVTLGERP